MTLNPELGHKFSPRVPLSIDLQLLANRFKKLVVKLAFFVSCFGESIYGTVFLKTWEMFGAAALFLRRNDFSFFNLFGEKNRRKPIKFVFFYAKVCLFVLNTIRQRFG